MDKELKSNIEPDFNRASKLRHDGQPHEALEIFNKLNDQFPNQPPIIGMLAAIHFTGKNFAAALPCFEKLVKLSPKSELASRGLFVSLMRHERKTEALDEARRFIKLRGLTDEYAFIMQELDENGSFD